MLKKLHLILKTFPGKILSQNDYVMAKSSKYLRKTNYCFTQFSRQEKWKRLQVIYNPDKTLWEIHIKD